MATLVGMGGQIHQNISDSEYPNVDIVNMCFGLNCVSFVQSLGPRHLNMYSGQGLRASQAALPPVHDALKFLKKCDICMISTPGTRCSIRIRIRPVTFTHLH